MPQIFWFISSIFSAKLLTLQLRGLRLDFSLGTLGGDSAAERRGSGPTL